MERLTVIGRKQDYVHVERSEALRIDKLLEIIPTLTKWTPLLLVAKSIDEKVPATISSIRLIWNAERIEKEIPYGKEIIATHPIFEIRKNKRNTRTNLKQFKYLRAPIYIKAPETYSNTIGGAHK